ncbi:MAG: LysR family transcriptional regulator, partial [Rubrivivax sp.]|nr:LysR family transcriptional regulator [Rubrivivax sp.]
VVNQAVESGALVTLLSGWTLPRQEIHAVFPSPRLVPAKVLGFVEWLQAQMGDQWWTTRLD